MSRRRGPLLVAGLGNPGFEYYLTPHNLGFMAADRIADGCETEISRPEAQALTAHVALEATEVILAKPQTYMNLSGRSVERLLKHYEIPIEDLVVLVDDADIALGVLRIRDHGSAGGHNGMKSIIGATGSDRFTRVRMGVKPDHPVASRTDYVLGRFREPDLETVAEMIDRAAEAVRMILREGVQAAMNRYNRRQTA